MLESYVKNQKSKTILQEKTCFGNSETVPRKPA